jgi:hypothetical protein
VSTSARHSRTNASSTEAQSRRGAGRSGSRRRVGPRWEPKKRELLPVGSTSHEPRQHDVCPLSLLLSMQAAQEAASLMPRAWLCPSGDHLRAGVRQAVRMFMRATTLRWRPAACQRECGASDAGCMSKMWSVQRSGRKYCGCSVRGRVHALGRPLRGAHRQSAALLRLPCRPSTPPRAF